MSDDNTIGSGLTAKHTQYLVEQAIDTDRALSLGVRSLSSPADTKDLGGVWVNWANFPAILFPWTSPDGHVEYQVRPDNPTEDTKGRARKYVFQRDMTPVLWAVQVVENPDAVVIIEGTKQCLAGASYAPGNVSVYGMAGIRMWQQDGLPIPDLHVVDGHEVIVIPDADASENLEVFKSCLELGEALGMEGAASVKFARLAGPAKAGLDDVLSKRPASRRSAWLARLIADAKPKPADRAPKPRKGAGKDQEEPQGDRVRIIVNTDRFTVINDLTDALLKRWNARELFNHGGVISRRKGTAMSPVDKGSFHDLIQETAQTVNENNGADGTTHVFCWPDGAVISATMSRADRFAQLDRVSHAPFVRPDGSIVTEPGYDEATRTILVPDEEFAGLEVPEEPTAEQVAAAREMILTDWLGDFPLDSDADRANLLALILTPAIRGMVPRAPMAVLDGLQMGVGKNLLADSILTVYTGQAAQPMNWVAEPDELRKQITSAFRTGAEFFVFDEAHVLEGTALAQALTAETWQDRILGVSTMAYFPNRVTWISLGNNVAVRGDITRRVYRIALRPKYANPQDRKASSFRHPGQSGLDLGSWTRKNRRELMIAILTLVRTWFAAGQPMSKRGVSFGSFEAWERITGGIIECAGLPGFLDNLKVWRSESDFDTQYWIGHLRWLRDQFGENAFKTAEVRNKALADPAEYAAPPRLDDLSDKAYGKTLGEAYSRIRDRRFDSLWLERAATSHGNVSNWQVHDVDPDAMPVEIRDPAPDSSPSSPECDNDPDTAGSDIEAVVTFDLETGDADQLYRRGADYIRIGAIARDDQEVVAYDTKRAANHVASHITHGKVMTGHNIMAFDLPALVRAGRITMDLIHQWAREGRIFDTLLAARLLDPPMARDKGVDATRRYDLGALGERYQLGEKLTDISKDLAKRYGGWDNIPIDDSEDGRAFKAYMCQDVELSRKLYRTLSDRLITDGADAGYLVREHRVAAVATQISINGFLVDQPLLAERVGEIQERKRIAFEYLSTEHGLPLADAKGVPYKSPLASKTGKAAIEKALLDHGVPKKALWRTPRSGDLQLSSDAVLHYGREYGQRSPGLREICKAIYRVVSSRSVYETISNSLAPDGRVHPRISFKQATGRWSLTDPGLTVMGKRGGRHVERAVLLPDPGEVLLSFDLSQVDMRAVAGLSQDAAYIEMLKREDPHRELAIALFGGAEFRETAKAIGHGWNYGESLRRISEENEIDPEIVRRFDTSMRERFPRLVEWREEVRALGETGALLDNGFGRKMRPDPQRSHTQSPALMGQGAARDIMMTGILRLPAECLPMLRAQVHDEIVLSVPSGTVPDVSKTVIDALSFTWRGVPILADVSPSGSDWSKCYEKG